MEPQRLKDLALNEGSGFYGVRENRFLRRWGSFGMTAGRIPQTETLICPGLRRLLGSQQRFELDRMLGFGRLG
jgi:hypothetical protein